jgi:hypothetical protein
MDFRLAPQINRLICKHKHTVGADRLTLLQSPKGSNNFKQQQHLVSNEGYYVCYVTYFPLMYAALPVIPHTRYYGI